MDSGRCAVHLIGAPLLPEVLGIPTERERGAMGYACWLLLGVGSLRSKDVTVGNRNPLLTSTSC